MWYRTVLLHSRHDSVDLYVHDGSDFVDVVVTYAQEGQRVCPLADRLQGSRDAIVFDQKGTPTTWVPSPLPDEGRHPKHDFRVNRARSGEQATVDFLRFHIANVINEAFADRGFSRFLRTALVGSWHDRRTSMTFDRDGSFTIEGRPVGFFLTAPSAGQWTVGRNMLHLIDHTGRNGMRTQVVAVRDDRLFLPGANGALHTVFERA